MDCVPRRPSLDKQPVGDPSERSVPADVQAVLTVLGRLNTKNAEPGRRLNLRKADLRGADLRDVNFREAILIEADLCEIPLDHANLQGANLALAEFRCTILQNANLRGARLAPADLRGADLTSADLRKAKLDGANFQWGPLRLTTEGIQGAIPASPSRRTQLKEADLRGATLRNAYFQGADLTNADFEGADLIGSNFGRAIALDANDRVIDDMPFGLAKQILFWVAGDLIQADRIFRSSRLFRPKWDERHGTLTYGQMTLANALKGVGEFYSPPG